MKDRNRASISALEELYEEYQIKEYLKLLRDPDLLLLHAPSVYDFRKMLIVPSPIADLVPSGTFYEMYPIGFLFLGDYLERHGIRVRVINLATRMLEKPNFDVESCIKRYRPSAFGIDLHWLPHCQGSIEIARLCKRIHPDVPVIFGGFTATMYRNELMQYPEIDYILSGDSTEEPLRKLLLALKGKERLENIPNLIYRNPDTGEVVENPLSYVPEDLAHLGNVYTYGIKSMVKNLDPWSIRACKNWWSYPVTLVLTCRGCKYNCRLCGGSAWTMRECFGREKPAFRSPEQIIADIKTINKYTGAPAWVIGDLRQGGDDFAEEILGGIRKIHPRNRLVFELFSPAPEEYFERLNDCVPDYALEFSVESHDEKVRRATGKHFTNQELEQNIRWALDNGCKRFELFFMIGLPQQTTDSVKETVAYCGHLMKTYGTRVTVLITPFGPFVDPFCVAHAKPEEHGYKILCNTIADYQKALVNPHWRDMLGYETTWMTKQDIVDSTYYALLELNRMKEEYGQISTRYMKQMDLFIRENMALLDRLDNTMRVNGPVQREKELAEVKREADDLFGRSYFVKEEIKWPIHGIKFNYINMLRIALRKNNKT